MALKNFIKDGFYARIERIDYSKQHGFINGQVVVYEDETTTTKMFETQLSISAQNEAVSVMRTITSEEDLFLEAPEYLDVKDGENVLIDIPRSVLKSDYARELSGVIIERRDGKLVFNSPYFIKKDGKYFECINGSYEETRDIVIHEQFLEIIDPNNLMKSFYDYLKSLPQYKGCIDA